MERISTAYDRADVLQDVSIEVQLGSITCLLGSNGSGKTTLIRSILGLTPPRSGQIPVQLRRCGGETRLIVAGRATGSTPARPSAALIKALVRAHAALDRLHADAPPGPRLARILPLAFLAPDITQAILDGTQPPQLTLARLCRPLPLAWPEQRRALGFSSVPIAPG